MANPRWRHIDRMLILLFGLSLVVRFFLTFYRSFNADEFQHLHASWMVHLGFTPYIDFWENHAPLLYYLSAPILSALGEGPHTVVVMRFLHSVAGVVIPAVVYKIARLDYDRTTAILSVVVLSFSEIYLQKTIEIRTDQFLVIFWLISLWLCFHALRSSKNFLFWIAGFFLGIAMLFSPKAIICYIPAALILFFAGISPAVRALKRQLLFFSGFIMPCAILGIFFYSRGLLKVSIESLIFQNLAYPDTRGASFLLLPQNFGLLLLGLAGMAISYRDQNLRSNARYGTPLLLMIAAILPATVLILFMPSTFSQSALTFIPLFAIYGAFAVKKSLELNSQLRGIKLLFVTFAMFMAFVIPVAALLVRCSQEETNQKQLKVLSYVLKHTKPDEAVFDGNSAYVFRKQAYFYGSLVEGIRYKIERREINKSVADSLRQNRCRIVLYDDRVSDLPEDVQTFIRSNYIPINQENVFIAGQNLDADDLSGNGAVFRIEIPLIYRIHSSNQGNLTIDNNPYTGPVALSSGIHRLMSDRDLKGVQVVANEP